ncbi:energy transducer TonB [Tenacibaculum sp. MEBiC06402]|uniref:energy transducer TonB n=1 Tax=unclassified Tenacibaculum TaxID=2635139 RepID=UPI003B9B2115
MKTKFLFPLALIAMTINAYSQQAETCETPTSDPVLDLNSITKCTIEKDEKKNTKKVSFEVSSRKRVKRKRDLATNVVSGGYQQTVSDVKKKTNLISDLSIEDDSKNGIISFYTVDQIPLFDKCEDTPYLEQESCFKKQMSHHIQVNFQYPKKAYKAGIQGRVMVNFLINKEGNTEITNILYPYKGELLKEEVERIINKLPKFLPGKHLGRTIDVQYTQQIKFKIPGVKRTNIRPKKVEEIDVNKSYTFEELEEVPLFEECVRQNDSSSDCFISELQKHVQENFAYPVDAINNDIEGTVNIIFVISNKGRIINIRTKGPDDAKILEVAAERLIRKLPKFQPALKDDIPVNTIYQFPITFKLN